MNQLLAIRRANAAYATEQISTLTGSLTRSGYASAGTEVDAILATPAFFRLTNRPQEAASMGADRSVVFVANENVHYGALLDKFVPIVRVDDTTLHVPSSVQVLNDAVHHRTNVVVFGDLPVTFLDERHHVELPQETARSSPVWPATDSIALKRPRFAVER